MDPSDEEIRRLAADPALALVPLLGGESLLMAAVAEPKLFAHLMRWKPPPLFEYRTPAGETVFDRVARRGSLDQWEAVVAAAQARKSRMSALHALAPVGRSEAWRAAARRHGANPNFIQDNQTPLMAAAQARNLQLVTWLLANGADANLQFGQAESLLGLAGRHYEPETCAVLLRAVDDAALAAVQPATRPVVAELHRREAGRLIWLAHTDERRASVSSDELPDFLARETLEEMTRRLVRR